VSRYLFTYGTLQPGRAPEQIAGTVAKLRRVGAASVRGVLYDCGEYPAAVLDATATEIRGTVWELPPEPDTLLELDAYEEFDSSAPASSLFRRVLHPVVLDSGDTMECWVYVYNRDPAGASLL
jgi:gamma-glutamylcyclotransferase (GGCT)/AIG2-like uncharacterized protein YtfP